MLDPIHTAQVLTDLKVMGIRIAIDASERAIPRSATIAEGVEDPTQQRILTELGCDSAQGYLISRPLTTGEARAFINERPDAVLLARQRLA